MKPTPEFTSKFKILKKGRVALALSATLSTVTLSLAAPSGGVVSSGSATIEHSGKVTNINQASDRASINWQKFGIKSDETVNFKQPDINSITLNRVVGNERSVIDGALNANGQVWILNSNGVLFGKNAKINTAGLLATTKELSDQDFNAGKYSFKGESTASVINMGTIDIGDSGYAVLLADSVRNEGEIKAIKGTVHLTGAKEATINLNGNSLVDLVVDKGVLDALVENKGAIYADGGEIYLTTNAADELLKGVVNNEGIIEANSIDGITGHVELFAHGGEAQIDGSIEAIDGFVETSGKTLSVKNSASIKAGKWLLDPTDVTIDDGDGAVGEASVGVSVIESALAAGDVTIEADNDINVNANLSNDTTHNRVLTLTADADNDNTGSINVNAVVTIGEGDFITLNYGSNGMLNMKKDNANNRFDGKIDLHISSTVTINGDTYTVVTALGDENPGMTNELQAMEWNLAANYVLGVDIDASATASWNSNKGFDPIGTSGSNFTGNFNGLGHTVSNLTINRPTEDYVGLFGSAAGGSATISNIGLTNVNINGQSNVGGLAGKTDVKTIANSYSTGSVTSTGNAIGGLVGDNRGKITNSYSKSAVEGLNDVGGLAGYNIGEIKNSYATGNVDGDTTNSARLGGLVGYNALNSKIEASYSTGSVTGAYKVGGLVGSSNGSTYISRSYSTGSVSGISMVGGLVGNNWSPISNSYATGTVTSTDGAAGALVGLNGGAGSITKSYALQGSTDLVGTDDGTTTESSLKTQEEMKKFATFKDVGWNIVVDSSLSGVYPQLRWATSGLSAGSSVWVIGEGTTPDPDPTPDPTPTPDPAPATGGGSSTGGDSTPTPSPTVEKEVETERENVDQVVITIVNQEATRPPKIELPSTQGLSINDIGSNVDINPDAIGSNTLISQPIEGQDTKKVSMSEAKAMQIESGGGDEVRVPLSRDSIIELVDGGVNLPEGVEQEFYVADEE